MKFRG